MQMTPLSSAQSSRNSRKGIVFALGFLLSLKALTWISGYWLAQDVSAFQLQDYLRQFHHHRLLTTAELSRPRPFFSLWNYADSAWYLSIAAHGYPTRAEIVQAFRMPQPAMRYTEKDPFLKYAFFPLFPLTISAVSGILGLEPSAFVLTLIFSIAAGVCFLKLFAAEFVAEDQRQQAALVLLFLYPFSIFYSLYHSESLFLLLSLFCFLAMHRRRYLLMWMFGFLLCLTRPNGIFITIPLLYALYRDKDSLPHRTAAYVCAFAIPLGLLPYLYLNWRNIGNPFFFAVVQSSWGNMITSVLQNVWLNTAIVGKNFMSLGFHRFHSSQLDFVVMLLFGGLIIAMWLNKEFPKHLVLWSTILWLVPLVSKDLMSFSRYMCVSFPVFMYLAIRLRPRVVFALVSIFAAGYFWALARVIHYQWLG